jgi:hypothetical protein
LSFETESGSADLVSPREMTTDCRNGLLLFASELTASIQKGALPLQSGRPQASLSLVATVAGVARHALCDFEV